MQFSFRPAGPEDAKAAAPLIYASGPDAFNYIFDVGSRGTALDFLEATFASKGGEFGYDNHLIVEADGQLCGIGACFSGKQSFAFTISIAWAILRFYGLLQGIGVMIRGLRFERIVKPPKRSEHAIVHLAVREDLRGQGIGSRLVHQLVINSRALPPCTYVLDVSEINPQAQALYERLGFKTGAFTPSNLQRKIRDGQPVEVPGHYRMKMEIKKKKSV